MKILLGIFFTKYDDTQHEIMSEYVDRLTIGSRGPVTSHLKAIKEWYDDTTEEVAFFCEDDIFKTLTDSKGLFIFPKEYDTDESLL